MSMNSDRSKRTARQGRDTMNRELAEQMTTAGIVGGVGIEEVEEAEKENARLDYVPLAEDTYECFCCCCTGTCNLPETEEETPVETGGAPVESLDDVAIAPDWYLNP